jgi:flagellar hook-basal body complex protein FliE
MQAITAIAQAVRSAKSDALGWSGNSETVGMKGGEASPGTPFAGLVTGAVQSMQVLNQQAASLTQGLMEGTGVDVHQAMIATEKAEQSFELALAVRNKAVAAYQQVMNLQF